MSKTADLKAQLAADEIVILRAYAKYMKQAGFALALLAQADQPQQLVDAVALLAGEPGAQAGPD